MTDHETFAAGDVVLQSGVTLPDARLAYATHGSLNGDKSNVVLIFTHFSGRHSDSEYLIGEGRGSIPESISSS